jgi:polyphenol oxidase
MIMRAHFIEPDWPVATGVRAVSTLKSAGGFGPDEADNREQLRVLAGLPGPPVWLKQVHGSLALDLDDQTSRDSPCIADAAITTRPGVVCAIQTADCLPVLLAADDASAVGAAHAGWRGLAGGVLESCVHALRTRATPGVGVVAWLGPAISAAHFEVGDEVRAAFLTADEGAAEAFVRNPRGRWQCDLYELARQRLARLGIEGVTGGEHCTYAEPDRFFSWRRDTVAGRSPGTGRMVSLVWMPKVDC